MTQPGLLTGTDVVFDPGVGAMAGFEELRWCGVCWWPSAGSATRRLPRTVTAGRRGGFFAAADDAHIGRPAGQPVAVGMLSQQGGQLHDTGLVGVARRALGVKAGVPAILRYLLDGGAFPRPQFPSRCRSAPGIRVGS